MSTRIILFIFMILALLCGAERAFAHASLVASEPADGSVIAAAPASLVLRFDEPVSAAVLRLLDAAGRQRDDIKVEAQDERITVALPRDLPRGTQVLSWHVVSADGHPVGGSLLFSIGAPSGDRAAAPVADPVLSTLIWLARLALFLGLFVGVGGAFFLAVIARARVARAPVKAALGIGIGGAILSLGLQGVDLGGLGVAALFSSAPWVLAGHTSLAASLAIAAGAMLLATASLAARGNASPWLSALALLGVGAALVASGHAATAKPQWLTRPAIFLHGIGVAYWVGALVPLLRISARPVRNSLAIIQRFSMVAIPVVPVLIACGIALTLSEIDSPNALVATNYGRILTAKLAAVLLLLALAVLNRLYLTRAAKRDPRPLARSIAGECVLVLIILALAAGWRLTPPPRSLAAAASRPVALHIHTDRGMAQLAVSPGRAGPNRIDMMFLNAEFGPLDPKEVSLALSLPAAGITPLKRQARRAEDGEWRVEEAPFPRPGRWHLRIEALVTDFEKTTLEGDIDIAP
jgi:copper transport protein